MDIKRTTIATEFYNEGKRVIEIIEAIADTSSLGAEVFDKQKSSAFNQKLVNSSKNFTFHETLISEIILTRFFDSYLYYLAGLLALVCKTNPPLLDKLRLKEQQGKKPLQLDKVFERRLWDLSHAGSTDVLKYFKKLDFKLYSNEDHQHLARLINELRNLIVHEQGIITNSFKTIFPEWSQKVGEKLELKIKTLQGYNKFLLDSVIDIDDRAIVKFGLKE